MFFRDISFCTQSGKSFVDLLQPLCITQYGQSPLFQQFVLKDYIRLVLNYSDPCIKQFGDFKSKNHMFYRLLDNVFH